MAVAVNTDKTTIQRWDREYVWHPFTQHTVWNAREPLVIVAGEGEFLIDADGKRYIDGVSSMWCNVHGHRHPAVDAAIKDQLDKIAHTTLLGLTHRLAVELAKRLVEIAPADRRGGEGGTGRQGEKEQQRAGGQAASGTQIHSLLDAGMPVARKQPRAPGMAPGTQRWAIAHPTQASTQQTDSGTQTRKGVEGSLSKVFYSDDGSTAVEVAIKMAYAYWHHKGAPQRRKFVALRNAYHGDTIGAVSVGAVEVFHGVYKPLLFETLVAPSPYCYRCELSCSPESCGMACAEELERVVAESVGEIAGVIVEPLMQCAGGMIAAPAGYLKTVREACDRHGVLLIADEIATGFGRTGRMFACESEAVCPDLLCIGKGLTNGYLPLAATLATQRIYEAFLGSVEELKTFFHGHTFTGNPLGCAAAMANLDVFEKERVLESLAGKIGLLGERLRKMAANRWVGDVRQCGLLAGVELVAEKATKREFPYGLQVGAEVCMAARRHGAILRPLGNTLVLFPPLSISMENLGRLMDIVETCIQDIVPNLAGRR
jgi:adenosylmethionine---8-amino-7-oxononanoate aminotransferase